MNKQQQFFLIIGVLLLVLGLISSMMQGTVNTAGRETSSETDGIAYFQ
jgi:hypothetical protein